MAWHHFQPGEGYPLSEVVATCERRVREGGVLAVAEKQGMVDLLRRHAPAVVVWSPFSTAWGASPFNPNCWRAEDGAAVVPAGVAVPELPE
ncbi:MAG: hypothetical protein K2X87_10330 [Gemmataceae bacterium]|nr:hypothetical protein [Gemmataceae bacterium]